MPGEGTQSAPNLAELDANRVAVEKRIPAELEKITYADPASVVPLPPAKEQVTMLVEDDFPAGAKVESTPAGRTLKWVTKDEGPVASGCRRR